jgi:hypothetical protein
MTGLRKERDLVLSISQESTSVLNLINFLSVKESCHLVISGPYDSGYRLIIVNTTLLFLYYEFQHLSL